MSGSRFTVGQRVRIADRTPPVHHRVPSYAKGRTGTIERICGVHSDPEKFFPGNGEPRQRLYRVRIRQPALWERYTGSGRDKLEIEIFENWLEAADDDARP
jgi:nitrile hydratase